ncbi:MAG TPA: response regulator, partial [Candidatus Methanofastidiosa archaeon]|nr:response regulator [Candidatus Methanofastidiosa archaeon]
MSSQLHILHVEDDEEYSRFISIQLNNIAKRNKSDRLIFDLVKSPGLGIQKIRNNRYDCVLCDYQLIGGTGLYFLYNIRPQGMELPLIFLT